jgi:hypothetical protein
VSFPLYFDEHVQPDLAAMLIARGHDVLLARDANKANQGISDEEQLRFATEMGRVMFSYNGRHFYRLSFDWQARGEHHAGIVVSPQRPSTQQLPRLLRLFELYPDGFPPDLCMQLPRAVV